MYSTYNLQKRRVFSINNVFAKMATGVFFLSIVFWFNIIPLVADHKDNGRSMPKTVLVHNFEQKQRWQVWDQLDSQT